MAIWQWVLLVLLAWVLASVVFGLLLGWFIGHWRS
jgi:hypothetical protein